MTSTYVNAEIRPGGNAKFGCNFGDVTEEFYFPAANAKM